MEEAVHTCEESMETEDSLEGSQKALDKSNIDVLFGTPL